MYRLLSVLALVAAFTATEAQDPPSPYDCVADSTLVSPQSCQNFKIPHLVSDQINNEMKAAYLYQAMASYFARDDVAWPGLSKFFYVMAAEERTHAQSLMDFMALRGGRVELKPVELPLDAIFTTPTPWGPVESMKRALEEERNMNGDLLTLHLAANDDPHFQNFLEEDLLNEQVNAIRTLSFYVTQTERLKDDNHALTEWDAKLSGDPHHA